MINEVTDHLEAFFFFEPHTSSIRPDDKARVEEQGSSILASPVTVMRLEVLVKGITIPRGFQRCGRFRQGGEVLSGSVAVHRETTRTYKRLTRPVLVYIVLRPLFALFVGPHVVPSMTAAIVDEQPPPRIVGKGLFSRLWNVEGRVEFCEVGGRHGG